MQTLEELLKGTLELYQRETSTSRKENVIAVLKQLHDRGEKKIHYVRALVHLTDLRLGEASDIVSKEFEPFDSDTLKARKVKAFDVLAARYNSTLINMLCTAYAEVGLDATKLVEYLQGKKTND